MKRVWYRRVERSVYMLYTAGPYFVFLLLFVEFIWSGFHESNTVKGSTKYIYESCVCFLLFVQSFATLSHSVLFCALLRIFTKILLLCFLILYFLSTLWAPCIFGRSLVHSFGRSFFPQRLLLFSAVIVVICSLYTSHIRFNFFCQSFFLIYMLLFVCLVSIHTRNKWFLSAYRLSRSGAQRISFYRKRALNAFVHSKQYYRRTHSKHTEMAKEERVRIDETRLWGDTKQHTQCHGIEKRQLETLGWVFKQKENREQRRKKRIESYCCCCCCCRLYSWMCFSIYFFFLLFFCSFSLCFPLFGVDAFFCFSYSVARFWVDGFFFVNKPSIFSPFSPTRLFLNITFPQFIHLTRLFYSLIYTSSTIHTNDLNYDDRCCTNVFYPIEFGCSSLNRK